MGDSIITIGQKKGTCFAGMAVTYDGAYKNENLPEEEASANLISAGVFTTEKEDTAFKSLVGENYSLFVNSTQLISESEDLDNFNASVHSSGVRGLFTAMENIIMIDSLYNIWAAVIDDGKVYYFTNNDDYKEKLPKTIDNWRQRFKDYPVVYK